MNDRTLPRLLAATLAVALALGTAWPSIAEAQARPRSGDDPPAKKEAKKSRSGKKSKRKRAGKKAVEKKPSKKKGSKKTGRKKADMSDVPPDQANEQEALQKLGEDFQFHRTRHYSVLYNSSEKDVKEFGVAIEQTYRSCVNYNLRLGIDVDVPKKKLLIYYFEQHADYSDHSKLLGMGERPQTTPGVYFPDLNLSMFYNFRNQESFKQAREQAEAQINDLRKRLRTGKPSSQERRDIQRQIAQARRKANWSNVVGGDLSESIVQHEVSHQVMWNIGFHNPKAFLANPRWFAEGTAMMFEPISDGSSANFGAVNQGRLREYQGLDRSRKLLPVRELVSSPVYFAPATMGTAYAQSWALVHYLNRVKRKQVRRYVELINKRGKDYLPTSEDEIATFEKAFGKLDRPWVNKWKRWMKNVR
jgi:hypothetical protein